VPERRCRVSEARDNRAATREIRTSLKVAVMVVVWLALIVATGQGLGALGAPGWLMVIAGVVITNVVVPVAVFWIG
jgi:hypothetical protein